MGWRNLKTLRQERLTDETTDNNENRTNSEETVAPANSDIEDPGNSALKNFTIDTTINEEGIIDGSNIISNKKARPMSI